MPINQLEKTEFCDKVRAKWVLDNLDKIPRRPCTDPNWDPVEELKKYCQKVIDSKDGVIKVVYKKSNTCDLGRKYAQGCGYQRLQREYRHTLASEEYHDLDIVNCQPTILAQYCKKNGIEFNHLQTYIKKRNEILEQLVEASNNEMTKDEVKHKILAILFGGKLHLHLAGVSFMKEFYNEIQVIMDRVVDIEKKIAQYVARSKPDKANKKGSVLSYTLQDIEDQLMTSCGKYLQSNGFACDTYVYDGVMVRKNSNTPLTQKHLNEMSDYCYQAVGYRVQWVEKPMDEGYQISNEELDEVDDEELNFRVISYDNEAARIVIKYCLDNGRIIVKSKNKWFLKVEGGIYTEDRSNSQSQLQSRLYQIIDHLDFRKENKKTGNIEPYSRNCKGAEQIMKAVKFLMKQDDPFQKDIWKSPLGKLCFKNGYWDFKKKKFVSWEEDDGETITCVFIDRDFNSDNCGGCWDCGVDCCDCVTPRKWVRENIMETIFNNEEARTDFLKWSARAMAGEFEEKTWAVGLGPRSSGKGVLTNLFCLAFGDYVQQFSAEQLFFTKCQSGDVAKQLSWIIPLEYARLYISNECKTEDESGKKRKLDGNICKSVASGGDELRPRGLYKDQFGMRLQGKMLLFMNEMVRVSPVDANETLVTFIFNTAFKNKLSKYEEFANLLNKEFKFGIADPNIKKVIADSEEILNAFVHLVIEHYEDSNFVPSATVQENNNDFHDSDDTIFQRLKEVFTFNSEVLYEEMTSLESQIGESTDSEAIKRMRERIQTIKHESQEQHSKHQLGVNEVKQAVQELRYDGLVISQSQLIQIFNRYAVYKQREQRKDNPYHSKWCWYGISLKNAQCIVP